jgi:hypothetical protein
MCADAFSTPLWAWDTVRTRFLLMVLVAAVRCGTCAASNRIGAELPLDMLHCSRSDSATGDSDADDKLDTGVVDCGYGK